MSSQGLESAADAGSNALARTLGRALRQARRARGYTLREAADRSAGGFRPTSIAGYERGERSISVERFVQLAALYGRSPESILREALASDVTAWHPLIDLTALDRDEAQDPSNGDSVDPLVRSP